MTFEQFQHGLLWLMFASSFIVKIEPAPVDFLFLPVIAVFAIDGMRGAPVIALLTVVLTLYNLGGLTSYVNAMGAGLPKSGQFIAVSIYMAIAAIFLAALLLEKTTERLRIISNGWISAAAAGSILALLGALDIGGLSSVLSFQGGRALGLFKDPNVLSTFMIFPGVLLVLKLIMQERKNTLLLSILLLLITLAIFLAFSRGAWINYAAALVLAIATTFVLEGQTAVRLRISIFVVVGVLVTFALLAGLLSIPAVYDLFVERFSLSQSYDVGETGRFGNQLNSIPLLLQAPLGFGPGGFSAIFGADPHNVYINAFASYGWIGGISYLLLVIFTIIVGFRTILMRGPWQIYVVAAFCALFTTILQGVQIDSDHWRHFYWMLGIVWGLYAATSASALASLRETDSEPISH